MFDLPPEKVVIDGYSFVLIGGACPEQYDVFRDGQQVAYLRLRWGVFTVEAPDCGGELLVEHNFDENLKGQFADQDERTRFLTIATEAIKRNG